MAYPSKPPLSAFCALGGPLWLLGMGEAHVSEAQLPPFLIAAAVSPPRVEGAGGLADLAQAVQA
jgi:hypothetical protein